MTAPAPAEAAAHPLILSVSGMTCASCAARIEKRLRQVPGVREANVNFAAQKAYVALEPGFTDPAPLEAAVAQAGYGAEVHHPRPRGVPREPSDLRWRVLVGAAGAFPFLANHLYDLVGHAAIPLPVQFGLALPVYALTGWIFHRPALL
ncbi:MAG TPA: cation transporter, partial [bacterium]|nr:cation transporter [bacterium]